MKQLIHFTAETVETFTPNSTNIFTDAKTAILSGDVSKAKVYILFHQFAEAFDMLKNDPETRDAFEREFLSHCAIVGKESIVHGFNIKVSDRKTYDFSACGDWTYNKAVKTLEEAKRQVTHREHFLKAVPHDIADPETGGIIQPPTVTYKRIISIAQPRVKKAA